MGYQKSPNFGSSSVGSSSFGSKKGKGVEMPSNVTMIKDIEPMLDNIIVQGRVISLWHSHRVNEAHNPYSLDFMLQDSQNSRIQVYIKKTLCSDSNLCLKKANATPLQTLPLHKIVDHWATMWDEYAQKHNELGHVVFILQLGKVKYWNGGDKKRVFIDLDSIESEDEEASGSSKTPKLITVKIEKEN
ncbi:replication protein A 70 kDa DNA-binding subunit B [Tanacetum coccineum]